MKLLGVLQMPSGTGEATQLRAGRKAGACVFLEQKLNRDFISRACRHHLHELIVAKVLSFLNVEPSSSPDRH